jgi:hypothetical protein
MENQSIVNVGEVSEPILELRLTRPAKKTHERGRVLPTFSVIDPKGENPTN